MRRPWTNVDDAMLTEIWTSHADLRASLHLLQDRTIPAALSRAYRIGLGTSAPCTRRKPAIVTNGERAIRTALSHGRALTTLQLGEITGYDYRYVGRLLRQSRGRLYHVAGWTRTRAHGDWYPRWALGRAEDAEKPALKPREESRDEYRRRQQLKQSNSPFAGLIQQVTA